MDWLDIKLEVHKKRMTLTELAIRNGLHPSICRKVKNMTNYKAQAAIAEFIGRKPEDLWPERYPQGKPCILDTKKYPPIESQKSNAAADTKGSARSGAMSTIHSTTDVRRAAA